MRYGQAITGIKVTCYFPKCHKKMTRNKDKFIRIYIFQLYIVILVLYISMICKLKICFSLCYFHMRSCKRSNKYAIHQKVEETSYIFLMIQYLILKYLRNEANGRKSRPKISIPLYKSFTSWYDSLEAFNHDSHSTYFNCPGNVVWWVG